VNTVWLGGSRDLDVSFGHNVDRMHDRPTEAEGIILYPRGKRLQTCDLLFVFSFAYILVLHSIYNTYIHVLLLW
jgi:hypothetical protein